jgi:hypothetical protein
MAIIVALTLVSAALLFPNRELLLGVLVSDSVGFGSKFNFAISLLGSITTNFSVFSASYLILVAIMFGVNISLLTYYIRRRQSKESSGKIQLANIGGIVSAVFGIGCMACGSIVLTALFGIFGAGAVIAFLPLHGFEFGIIGLLLLSVSVYYIIKRINDPLVCR